MSLERIVRMREMVAALCQAIDAGEVTPTEEEMLALAVVVQRHAGPFAHDLCCQLAARSANGRAVLAKIAQ